MTVEQLVEKFTNYPSYLKKGSLFLANQFNVSEELIHQAKAQIRELLKADIMKDLKQDSMSLRDLAKLMGITDVIEEQPEVNINWNNIKTTNKTYKRDAEKESLKTDLKSLLEEVENVSEWEEKIKWVKTKGESKLLVKKFPVEDFKKSFSSFLETYVSPKPTELLYEDNSSALLVYMADKHIGAKTKENSLFDNEYNAEEFSKRMDLLADKIISLYREKNPESILLIDFGDAIDGMNSQTTRGGHVLPQNMNNREVFTTFLTVHMDFIGKISDACKCDISYISAGESNHGGDYEWVCNKALEATCQYKYPEVNFFIGDKFIEHFTIADHCFIICHGKDMEDMKNPLPLNLDAKTELYFKKYMDAHGINSKYTHIIKGDLHSAACQYGEFFRYKNVLSMYGASKWIQTNFMVNTKGVCIDVLYNNQIEEHYLFFN